VSVGDSTKLFHVIDPRNFERRLLDELCELATRVRAVAKFHSGALYLQDLLPTRRAMLYFTQPSTRTFLSFNNACHVLGMRTSEIRDPSTSSEVKGERFEDSIRTFSSYVDIIIMRTREPGRAAQAARLMDTIARPIPVITQAVAATNIRRRRCSTFTRWNTASLRAVVSMAKSSV
jgi:aspartate carbamoyltransferase catalytic subunit